VCLDGVVGIVADEPNLICYDVRPHVHDEAFKSMARIDIQRDHHLDATQARAVVDKVAARLGEKFGTTSRWEGDTLRFERPGVKGGITLEPALVRVQAELGMLLSPMKGMIEQEIRQKLDQYFA